MHYSDFTDYCIIRYRDKANKDTLIAEYIEKTNDHIDDICPELFFVFQYILSTSPCVYWNDEIRKQTKGNLTVLLDSSTKPLSFNIEMVEYLCSAFDTYRQITEIINDFASLNLYSPLKIRLYQIPTYVSILEGCLSNLYRLIGQILDQLSEKDYKTQKLLEPLCNMLMSTGFTLLVKSTNVGIRNAINHGNVLMLEDNKVLVFTHNRGKDRKPDQVRMNTYEFEKLIEDSYDACSAILLGIVGFMNEHIQLLRLEKIYCYPYISFKLLAMKISIPRWICTDINDASIDNRQMNVFMEIEETDKTVIIQTSIEILSQIYWEYPDYESYYIQYKHPRMLLCFVRFQNNEVKDFLNDHTLLNHHIEQAIKRGDIQLSSPSTEKIDMSEIKYYIYPNYREENFYIDSLENASLEDRKRLRAHLFVGKIDDRIELLAIIERAVGWIRQQKNVAVPSVETKHGNMLADSVYLNVYRFENRKNRNLYINNENFICMVDYNYDGKTTLQHGGVLEMMWRQYHHETIGNYQIAWRTRRYCIDYSKQKIARNQQCPCGSGEKYKRCCGKTNYAVDEVV